VTDPASPPAMNAKPTKRTARAFHATPLPEYVYAASPDNRDLSMEFILQISTYTQNNAEGNRIAEEDKEGRTWEG